MLPKISLLLTIFAAALVIKLTGKDDLIREYLKMHIPQSVMARLLGVNRLTVRNYIITRKLKAEAV